MAKPSTNKATQKDKGPNGTTQRYKEANESEDKLNNMRQNKEVRW